MPLTGDVVLMERGRNASKRHELKSPVAGHPTIYRVTQDHASLNLTHANSTDGSSSPPVAILHHAPGYILKIEALVPGISVHPGHLDELSLNSEVQSVLRLEPHSSTFLRPGDIVRFQTSSHSEIRLKFDLEATMEVPVQVNSSMPRAKDHSPDRDHQPIPSTLTERDEAIASNASVQISRSMPHQSGTLTPKPREHQKIVQETPATDQRHYEALSRESRIPKLTYESGSQDQMSKIETQIKSEEMSQDNEKLSDSPSAVPSPRPEPTHAPETVTDSFQCGQPRPNSEIYPTSLTDVQPSFTAPDGSSRQSSDISNVVYTSAASVQAADHETFQKQPGAMRDPTPSAPQSDNGDSTGEDEDSLSNGTSTGVDLATAVEGVTATHSTPSLPPQSPASGIIVSSNVIDSGGKENVNPMTHIHGEEQVVQTPEQLLEEVSSSNTSKDAAKGSVPEPITEETRQANGRSSSEPATARNRKRNSTDALEDISLQASAKRVKRTDTKEPSEENGTDSEESSESDGGGIIRPRQTVAVVVPSTTSKNTLVQPAPAGSKGVPSKQTSMSKPATPSKRHSITPRRSSARIATNPPSSTESRSSRSRASKSRASFPASGSSTDSGKAPRVVFSNSNIPKKPSVMKFFTGQGGKTVDQPTSKFDVLVVGNGELKKTSKFLMSVALGKYIATESWLTQSTKEGKILDVADFIPNDPEREKAWGFSLRNAAGKDRRHLFDGLTIALTSAVKKEYDNNYSEFEELAKTVGVKAILKYAKDVKMGPSTVVLASGREDQDAIAMMSQGTVCYSKDLLSISILRGKLDLESKEFKIVAPSSAEEKKKGRGRKSG